MTRWRGNKQQVERSMKIQLLLGVYCSAMHTSSALQTSVLQHHSVHALSMGAIIVQCIWGCSSNEINLPQTTLAIPVQYTRGCMLGRDPNDFQTRCCQYTGIPLDRLNSSHTDWCCRPVVFQWQSRAHHLHNWNTLEHHWSHKCTGMPLELHWLLLAPSSVPVTILW